MSAYTSLADASFLAEMPTVPLVEEAQELAEVIRQIACDTPPDGLLHTPIAGVASFTGPNVTRTGYSLGDVPCQTG